MTLVVRNEWGNDLSVMQWSRRPQRAKLAPQSPSPHFIGVAEIPLCAPLVTLLAMVASCAEDSGVPAGVGSAAYYRQQSRQHAHTEPTREPGTDAAKDEKTDSHDREGQQWVLDLLRKRAADQGIGSPCSPADVKCREEEAMSKCGDPNPPPLCAWAGRLRELKAITEKARQKLDSGDPDRAEVLASLCLESAGVPAFDPSACGDIQKEARKRIATDGLALAQKYLAAKRARDAGIAASRCVRVEPENAACLEIQQRFQTTLDKLTTHHVKEVAVYPEGDGFRVYFSLVNKLGDYIRDEGQVVVSAIRMSNVMIWDRAEVASFVVRPKDFQLRTIGLGAFGRPAIIWSTWISRQTFPQHFTYQGDPMAGTQYPVPPGLFLEVAFRDARGFVFRGRERFSFD